MKALLLIFLLVVTPFIPSDKIREIEYNGQMVKTTFEVPANFYGKYSGNKSGYLTLNEDGTGIYNYDVFGFAFADCKKGLIHMEWGFLLDGSDIVKFEREYGLSYPILMKSTGETQFQGCRKETMLDFIMLRKNGEIEISSSDDWMKK